MLEGAQNFTLHHPKADDRAGEVLVVFLLEEDDRLLQRGRHAQQALDAVLVRHTERVAAQATCPLDAVGSVAGEGLPPLVDLLDLDELEPQ